eukprot:COSAG06_NODE_1208_length_10261_cov_5.380634_4_plen_85_part_00
MLGDRPGFDGIPSNSAAAKDNRSGCGTAKHVCTHGVGRTTKFNASQLPVKASIAEVRRTSDRNRNRIALSYPSYRIHQDRPQTA